MRRLEASDLRDSKALKHYRIVRKWICRNYGINDADLELLVFLDCQGIFSKTEFKLDTYAYSWDNNRFSRLLKDGWIVVWRHGNKKLKQGSLYKISLKTAQLLARMYRILTGEENIPTGITQNVTKSKAYTDRVLQVAIKRINNDKEK
jgi:hypothetical protein